MATKQHGRAGDQVLAIPVWFTERGHDVTNKGRPFQGPLRWYRAPIHSGRQVEAIRKAHGDEAEANGVFLYDRLCQIAANQPLDRRGMIFAQRGKPMTVADIAYEMVRSAEWVRRVLDVLLQQGWVQWITVGERLLGAPASNGQCSVSGGPAADQGPPEVRPQQGTELCKDKDKDKEHSRSKEAPLGRNGKAGKTASSGGPAVKANTPATQFAIVQLLATTGVAEVDFRGLVSRFAPIAVVRLGAERFRESHKRKPIRNAGGWWRIFLRKNGVEL